MLVVATLPGQHLLAPRRKFVNGIDSSIVGEVVPKAKGIMLVENNVETKLVHPRIDPFWIAFAKEAGKL